MDLGPESSGKPAGEPAAKRQRKEPVWKTGYVDPNKVNLKGPAHPANAGAQDDDSLRQHAGSGPSGDDLAGTQVLHTQPIDANRVELVVLHKGRRYRGVLERTALPPSVGVTTRLTKEELAASAAAPAHGENPSNMCALCNTHLEDPPIEGSSADKGADMYVKVRITSNWTARVHRQCAIWCPECKEDPYVPGYYHHMGPAVRRGRALRCKECKGRGATVGCFQDGCPAVYHLPCAVHAGCMFDDRTMEVWCPSHLP